MPVISPAAPESRAASLPLVGGALALDFANTESGRGFPTHRDHLREARHVADWLQHAGALAPDEAEWLRGQAAARPDLAAALLTRAKALREDVGEIFRAVARGATAPAGPTSDLTAFHAGCLACSALAPSHDGYVWRWPLRASPIEAALGPIALSAVTLLSRGDLSRIKQCAGVACGWMFYDETKNKRRRWCEMEVCGNRAKQRRYAARGRPA
ncbi:MAG: CGNR zinc finger domain-containing protein [Roseiarcus sp.]|jgi:predicted RNA-binding Zn ribbon-like protein